MYNIINCKLAKISNWFKLNKLSVNIKKTNFIAFRTINKFIHTDNKFQIFIDNVAIEQVEKTTFLGVVINSTLTWSDHLKTVCSKLSKDIGNISGIRHKVNFHVLLMLYRTHVQCYCKYCNIV